MRFITSGLFFVLVSAMMMKSWASPIETAAPQHGVLRREEDSPSTTTMATNEETTTPTGFQLTLDLNLPTHTLDLNLPSNTCTPTVAPDKNGWVPASECDALYLYYPSFKAAIAATVVFGLIMMAHFVQATMYKSAFVWVALMGVSWETVGYGVRALSTRDQQDNTIVTVTQMFILLAPLCTIRKTIFPIPNPPILWY